ncbi:MAG: hypothetical protein PHQ04_02670 [Opitutaceae bacterium]|nr:hypothetical protein [Opitutaceae bacterium]
MDRRLPLLFLTNLLLAWLAGQVNHSLAPMAVHLYLGGLFVAFAALRLDLKNGGLCTVLTALACDSTTAAPFGTSLVLFGLAHATVLAVRQGFPRDEPVFATVVTLILNLFLFLACSFVLVGLNPRPADAWLRLFVDLIASQLVLAFITPWFFALQARVFELARLDPETGRPAS